ncbi:hypothetical protein GYMLUDRAFT_62092 [Collybiopsis luxurians FD-317 M1]|uniref:DUF6534 domain-containing protein n=1 Tax=Collybiopsis luxurians FD-317 M1 TaxID=944289 RepID=A0A0D0CM23_9AGAR|nr:hypothetical protein GYMLUDRAFT_62092 [Collybiopsis luxurians FD-317 M1]
MSSSSTPSTIPPQAFKLPNMNTTIGALQIGLVLSILLVGIALAQGYTFFSRPSQELKQEKRRVICVVAALLVLDILQSAFSAHAVYFYTVTNGMDIAALDKDRITHSHLVSQGFMVVISQWFATKAFLPVEYIMTKASTMLSRYSWQKVYSDSCHDCCAFFFTTWFVNLYGASLWARVLIGIGSPSFRFFNFTSELLKNVALNVYRDEAKLFSMVPELMWTLITALALVAACDVLIAISLCYYLNASRTGFYRSGSTETLIDRLILWTVSTGLLTSVFAVAKLVCIVAMQNNLVYVGVFFVGSKYLNSELRREYQFKSECKEIIQIAEPASPNFKYRVQGLQNY